MDIKLNTDICRQALKAALRFADESGERPHLYGVLLEQGDMGVVFTATNGRCITRIRCSDVKGEPARIFLPHPVARFMVHESESYYERDREDAGVGNFLPDQPDTWPWEHSACAVTVLTQAMRVECMGLGLEVDSGELAQSFVNDHKPDWKGWGEIIPPADDRPAASEQGINPEFLGLLAGAAADLGKEYPMRQGGMFIRAGREATSAFRADMVCGPYTAVFVIMPIRKFDTDAEPPEHWLPASSALQAATKED